MSQIAGDILGPVIFRGGPGTDRFDLDTGGILKLSTAIPADGTSEPMAWVSWHGTVTFDTGLYWEAEQGAIDLYASTNLVYLEATASDCQTLAIVSHGYTSDSYIEAWTIRN